MSKFFKVCFLAILLCFYSRVGAFAAKDKQAEKILVVGMSTDYPPFEFVKDRNIVGFDVDLANKIADKLGYKLQINSMKFSNIISSLHTGRIDFAISGMNATPERKKNVDFSIQYYNPQYAMLYRKAAPIRSFKNLNEKVIGAQIGSTMEMILNDKIKAGKKFKIVSLEKNTVMVEELKVARLDGVFLELAQAKAFVKIYTDVIAYADFGSKGAGYAIAFKKGSLLRKEFNKAIISLKESGELENLEQKWLTK